VAPGDAGIFVVGLSRGSPADDAGLEQGDQITAVDGAPVGPRSPFQVAAALAGPDGAAGDGAPGGGGDAPPPDAVVSVRKADGRTLQATLSRPRRDLPSPVSYRLASRRGARVATIRLSSFNARAQRDVAAAIAVAAAGGAEELELDLRGNRGGLVSEGLEMARLFLGGGAPIVLAQSRVMAAAPPRADGPPLTTLPLTVLVDGQTASASEILAGALRDNCRALLVGGGRTYGKGLIQSVYELSDSSGLVVTVGKYLTPAGVDIDRSGIAPDFREAPRASAAAAALRACRVSTAPAVAANVAAAAATAAASAAQAGGGARPP